MLKRRQRKRPFLLKLLILVFLIISGFGWSRLYEVIRVWEILGTYSTEVLLVYIAVSGVFLGMIGLGTAAGLLLRSSWAPLTARSSAILCSVWYWLDRLLLGETSTANTNLPFATALNFLGLIFTFVVLSLPDRIDSSGSSANAGK
ncbi:MAG: hypothetical protein MUO76_04125 [Anaerolineaceae bacterium]|nr:hypothetical protein [Anaerolineaceae bacterium]